MKIIKTLLLSLCLIGALSAQEYKPTWESLDSRKCPQWFSDAKFGIFIHWGLYSVPAYTSKGTYAEWYQHALEGDTNYMKGHQIKRHKAITSFHDKHYGKDVEYADFRKDFNGKLFNPEEWANIFKRSGAKYVVLTSKHHDGYCLWDSKEADTSHGKHWNAVTSGPHRDLVGDLTTAVRSEGLKMGLYYSIWEWFNPYWVESQQKLLKSGNMMDNNMAEVVTENKDEQAIREASIGLNRYVHNVMYPQFKELVNKYQPSLLFSDGDWWMDDKKWQTKPLLAWLFNNAPNKDEVVINDRWGKVRGKYGSYLTTEYGSGFKNIDKPWEENRGIGMSFGYNRIENIDDYRTAQELIFMLVDIVSRGGNLLLNVGPTADGRVPVIMQERLLDIGKWLDVNGEAIYGTKKWKTPEQWSKGKEPVFSKSDYHSGFPIYEMTISPKKGNAVKECWFTTKDNNLYAMTPLWVKGDKFTINDVAVTSKTKVTLLGYDKPLKYTAKNGKVVIDVKGIPVHELPAEYIYAFKISNIVPDTTIDSK